MKKQSVKVTTKKEEMPSPEILAEEIAAISRAARAFNASRLKQRAILLLLSDMTKLPMTNIQYVLNALPELEATYLKAKV